MNPLEPLQGVEHDPARQLTPAGVYDTNVVFHASLITTDEQQDSFSFPKARVPIGDNRFSLSYYGARSTPIAPSGLGDDRLVAPVVQG